MSIYKENAPAPAPTGAEAEPNNLSADIQHQRHRHRDRRKQIQRFALLAEPFQQHIAAQGEAGRCDRRFRFALPQRSIQEMNILRFAGMLTARQTIRLPAAAPEIQCGGAKSQFRQLVLQASDVAGLRTAGQTVQQYHDRPPFIAAPVDVEKIVIRRGEPLPPQPGRAFDGAEESRKYRLQVSVFKPPGRFERTLDDHCGRNI